MLPSDRLKAFEHADRLAHLVYDLTAAWPRDELYGLIRQARRAAFSVPANIAEGARKHGPREFARYLDIAVGSLAELTYALRFARKRGWMDQSWYDRVRPLREETARTLSGLHSAIQRAAKMQRVSKRLSG